MSNPAVVSVCTAATAKSFQTFWIFVGYISDFSTVSEIVTVAYNIEDERIVCVSEIIKKSQLATFRVFYAVHLSVVFVGSWTRVGPNIS